MPLLFEKETFLIIGNLFEVHKQLGGGFSEVVYKDALQYEFDHNGIEYEREKRYEIKYKNVILPHKFLADFVLLGKIILEIKSCKSLTDEHIANVLTISKYPETRSPYLQTLKGSRWNISESFSKPEVSDNQLIRGKISISSIPQNK